MLKEILFTNLDNHSLFCRKRKNFSWKRMCRL